MQAILLLNSVSFLALAALCWVLSNRSFRNRNMHFAWAILSTSFFYLASAVLNAIWAFNLASPSPLESIMAGSAFVMPVAALLSFALYRITSDRKILVFFSIFALCLFGFGMKPENFLFIIIFVSFLLLLLIGVNAAISKSAIAHASIFIAAYGATGAAFTFLSTRMNLSPIWFIPNLGMAMAYYLMIGQCCRLNESEDKKPHSESVFVTCTRYLIFVITLLAFLFLSTIAIHEIGHGAAGALLGCETESVIFNSQLPQNPFTQVNCANASSYLVVDISGVMLPLVFGLFLLFLGRGFIRSIGLEIISIGIFLSYGDLSMLNVPLSYIILAYIFAGFFMAIAILRIGKSYLRRGEKREKQTKPESKPKAGQKI